MLLTPAKTHSDAANARCSAAQHARNAKQAKYAAEHTRSVTRGAPGGTGTRRHMQRTAQPLRQREMPSVLRIPPKVTARVRRPLQRASAARSAWLNARSVRRARTAARVPPFAARLFAAAPSGVTGGGER